MQWIKDIVTGLIENYNTRNIHELLECLEIQVIKKDLISGVKGSFFRDIYNNEYIFLSSNLSYEEEKIVLAHELGHAILHTNISNEYYYGSFLNKTKIERQANFFAAEILIDESVIEKITPECIDIEKLSLYFKVPKELLTYKITDIIERMETHARWSKEER